MSVDTFVVPPESIKRLPEVDEVLICISQYEQENQCQAGVIALQNRTIGGIYRIVSKDEASDWLAIPNTTRYSERGIKYYPKEYFQDLKARLRRESSR